MKKIILIVVVVGLVSTGAYLFLNTSNDYEVVIVDRVAELESELTSLEQSVASGTLTPEQAATARANIINKLQSISDSTNGTEEKNLTAEQKLSLQAGLQNLKEIVVRFESTLTAIDTIAVEGDLSDSSSATITATLIEAVNSVEQATSGLVDGYAPDTTLDSIIEDIDDRTPDVVGDIDIEETESATSSSDENQTDQMGEMNSDTTPEQEQPADADTPQ